MPPTETPLWGKNCRRALSPIMRPIWEQAAHMAHQAIGHKLAPKMLNLNCGLGTLTEAFVPYNFACTAVDRNIWMIQEAGARLPEDVEFLVAANTHIPLPDHSFDVAVAPFALHGFSSDHVHAVLAEMRRLAPLALIVDWQMPERNISIPATACVRLLERLTSPPQHYTHFRSYMDRGALEGIFYSQPGRTLQRHSRLAGSLALALFEWD